MFTVFVSVKDDSRVVSMTVGELKELISETFGIKKGKQLKKDLRVPRETKVSAVFQQHYQIFEPVQKVSQGASSSDNVFFCRLSRMISLPLAYSNERVNPITVGNFVFLYNCTPVGRTSDSMMVPT